jgi:hypothetical protein
VASGGFSRSLLAKDRLAQLVDLDLRHYNNNGNEILCRRVFSSPFDNSYVSFASNVAGHCSATPLDYIGKLSPALW